MRSMALMMSCMVRLVSLCINRLFMLLMRLIFPHYAGRGLHARSVILKTRHGGLRNEYETSLMSLSDIHSCWLGLTLGVPRSSRIWAGSEGNGDEHDGLNAKGKLKIQTHAN